uniref:DUF218 domain-containing protein n=1 Tax=Alexandrium catenella TaxID=2925 RepID=A0A7S1MT32_ALECA
MAHSQILWKYLSPSDELAVADFIVGFGHFDQRIAARCAALHKERWAPKVLFTGGVGSGSAGLSKPEAEYFKEEALRLGVPPEDIILETESTNTPENVRKSLEVLEKLGCSSAAASSFILVATPYRQQRVFLTCQRMLPEAKLLLNSPPESSYDLDVEVFGAVGESLDQLLVDEVGRIKKYGEKGDIARTEVPEEVERAMLDLGGLS